MENHFSLNGQNDQYFKLTNNLLINLLDHISDVTENSSDDHIQEFFKVIQDTIKI